MIINSLVSEYFGYFFSVRYIKERESPHQEDCNGVHTGGMFYLWIIISVDVRILELDDF